MSSQGTGSSLSGDGPAEAISDRSRSAGWKSVLGRGGGRTGRDAGRGLVNYGSRGGATTHDAGANDCPHGVTKHACGQGSDRPATTADSALDLADYADVSREALDNRHEASARKERLRGSSTGSARRKVKGRPQGSGCRGCISGGVGRVGRGYEGRSAFAGCS